MKKITLSLLAAVGLLGSMKAQLNYQIVAPFNNNSTSEFRAPNGTVNHSFQRTVMYISAAELLPMSLATITSFSYQLTKGLSGSPVTGNLTVWMQNTGDMDYLKGTNFTTATGAMTQVYNGPHTVPVAAAAASVGVQLSGSGFNYTGGGLYIAWDWVSTGPFSVATATYACNNQKTQCATAEASVSPVSNTLNYSNFRPSLVFRATNTATNDVGVLDIEADGHVSKLFGAPQTVYANVVNSSIGAQSNVTVALVVSGANSFNTSAVIPSMPPGSIATVTFNSFSSPNSGIQTLSVAALFADQNLNNNARVWTQSVTCNEVGTVPPVAGSAFITSNAYGLGSTGAGFIYTTRYVPPATGNLTAVRMVVANLPTYNIGYPVTPMILDNTGTILYTGNPVITTAGMLGTWTNIALPAPQQLNANTEYYIGVSVTSPTFYPISILNNTYTPYFLSPGFYTSPLAGGSITQVGIDYFGLMGVMQFTSTQITAVATKTAVCKGSPQQVTLTATGAQTYTWSAPGLGNAGTAVYTPTASGNIAQVTVAGNYTTGPQTGCKTNNATLTFTLLACNGVAENTGADAVRLFPNPSVAGKTTISNLSGVNTITVFNTLGQVVYNTATSNETEDIDISQYPAGNYLVKVTNSNNESRTLKLINQN